MIEQPPLATDRASLIDAEPQLFVADVQASIHFFETVLSFSTAFTYGNPPFYAQVARDGVRLNLRATGYSMDAEARERDDLLAASITVENIQSLYDEFTDKGATFHKPLKTEPWGARTFIVKDPDGNLILFAA